VGDRLDDIGYARSCIICGQEFKVRKDFLTNDAVLYCRRCRANKELKTESSCDKSKAKPKEEKPTLSELIMWARSQ
jgi:hypothetical protein